MPTSFHPQPRTSKTFEYVEGVGWRTVSSHDMSSVFHYVELPLDDLDDLARAVEAASALDFVLLRGGLTDAARAVAQRTPRRVLNRRMHAAAHGDVPSMCDAPRRWVMLDIDHWPCPPHLDVRDRRDHEQIVDQMIRDALPSAFHDARCFAQFSASCGQHEGVVKAHLFFWLATPATGAELEARLAGVGDVSAYRANQPLYIATPSFIGASDPLPARFVMRDEVDDEVALPEAPPAVVTHRAAYRGTSVRLTGEYVPYLQGMGDGEGLGGFHAPIRSLIWDYAFHVLTRGIRDDEAVIEAVQSAVAIAPKRRDRTNAEGYSNPRVLSAQIAATLRKRVVEFPITADAICRLINSNMPDRFTRARVLLSLAAPPLDPAIGLMVDDAAALEVGHE